MSNTKVIRIETTAYNEIVKRAEQQELTPAAYINKLLAVPSTKEEEYINKIVTAYLKVFLMDAIKDELLSTRGQKVLEGAIESFNQSQRGF